MNKYKNKTLYRLIPIKATVLFFSVKSSEFFFFSLCFVVLTLKNKNSVICLSIVYKFFLYSSFTHSKLVFPSIKVNVDQQMFGYPRSSKYLILCSALERNLIQVWDNM